MYSNKENVAVLTALLAAHGVTHAVVCPGSRNAPLVHNLNECPSVTCCPVTDERSAGFYALGMAQATGRPVVVCVTSGSALLNLMPAVAEAFYQNVRLVVVSADRPPQWIDQYDGQTLPQPGVFGPFVRKTVSLPEPRSAEERWYCNRLVNEAMLVDDGPVHINVPISEPLFEFTQPVLPEERMIECPAVQGLDSDCSAGLSALFSASRPLFVLGHTNRALSVQWLKVIRRHLVVLHESLYPGSEPAPRLDEALHLIGNDPLYRPDCVVYAGGTFVSKRLKAFLRSSHCPVVRLSAESSLADLFMNTTHVVSANPDLFLQRVAEACEADGHAEGDKAGTPCRLKAQPEFLARWKQLLARADRHADEYLPAYSGLAAVKYFEQRAEVLAGGSPYFHYANSTAVRLANSFARHRVYCNRGLNGIEGSLSTAAGCSVVAARRGDGQQAPENVFCVIGDLSFFYDQNALWNRNLGGNLRILLLNNGCGSIFRMLRGLEQSTARDGLVAAAHHTSAEGICLQDRVVYLRAAGMEQMQQGIDRLLSMESDRPVLLEVFTDAADDERVYKDYYQSFK